MKKIDKNAVAYGMPIELMMKNDRHMSPKFQMRQGITINQIECNEELQLIFKASDGSPACVKESNMEKLVQRGWGLEWAIWREHEVRS